MDVIGFFRIGWFYVTISGLVMLSRFMVHIKSWHMFNGYGSIYIAGRPWKMHSATAWDYTIWSVNIPCDPELIMLAVDINNSTLRES